MLNSIQADFYRLIRSRGFKISQILLIILIVTCILSKSVGNNGAHPNVDQIQEALQSSKWTADIACQIMSTMASFLLYFGTSLSVIIVGYDLTHKTYKNILTNGISRLAYFSSKYLILLCTLTLQLVIYYLIVSLTSGVLNGWGTLNHDFWMALGRTFLLQVLCNFAIFSVALIALYTFFSNVASVLTALIFPLVLALVRFIFNIDFLGFFTFQNNIDSAWIIQGADAHQYYAMLGYCLLTCAISFIMSYFIFQKKSL